MPGIGSEACVVALASFVVIHFLRNVIFRFIVREFTYNEEELAAGKNEITKLVTDKKKQFVSTQNLIGAN